MDASHSAGTKAANVRLVCAVQGEEDLEAEEIVAQVLTPTRGFFIARRSLLGLASVALAAGAVGIFARGGRAAPRESSVVGGFQQLDDLKCTGTNQDCRSTRCCKRSGQTCFEKNEFWATCMDSCAPGVRAGDPDNKTWSCKALGERTRFEAGCAWPGQDCSQTKTCCTRGFKCVKKDDFFSGCEQVEKGPWEGDTPAATVPLPEGYEGTELGGWRSEFKVDALPLGPGVAGTSLFCFMAVLPGSPEEALVQLARDRKAGIFGCEGSAVYHSTKSEYHTWDTGVKTLVNTATFIKIWDAVRDDGMYLRHDWTVKADADCVFFPDRLRSHLKNLGAPALTPIYLKNTLPIFTLGGFLGAIEILSKTATEVYLDNAAACREHIGLTSGEDGFLKDCVDSLGVGFMHDDSVLRPSGNPAECQVVEFVAFHPFKDYGQWQSCYDMAVGNVAAPPAVPMVAIDRFPESFKEKYRKKWYR